jgi:hypothetical protein
MRYSPIPVRAAHAYRRLMQSDNMAGMSWRIVSFSVIIVIAVVAAVAAAQELSRADAESMSAKLEFIIDIAESAREADAPPARTAFTDAEINAYLMHYGPTFLPPGVADPRVRVGDPGHVSARGVVDLDAVRRSRKRAWHDPLAYLTGALEVTATGIISAEDGVGVVQFESATVAGISVPQRVVQEIVRHYTVSPERPNGFGFDEPFELPANVRSVTFEHGRTTVVQ